MILLGVEWGHREAAPLPGHWSGRSGDVAKKQTTSMKHNLLSSLLCSK